MWAATMALNGMLSAGVPTDWASHMIGQEITALYGIDHARTLAIVMPALWRLCKKEKAEKLAQYGARVWNIPESDSEKMADEAINATVEFFELMGVKTRLSELARLGAGAAAGLAWSLLAGFSRRIVDPLHQGRAMAIAMAGTPLALSLGVPLGTWLGHYFGWRLTFGIMSVLSLLLMIWIRISVPDSAGQQKHQKIPFRKVLATPGVRPVLAVVLTWMLAHNILYTYIAPFSSLSGMGAHVDGILLIFGLSALAGLIFTGKIIDSQLRKMVLASLAIFSIVSLFLGLFSYTPAILIVGSAVWGVTFGGAATLLNTALADAAEDGADVAISMTVVSWNAAIALGGITGGIILQGPGVNGLPWVILILALVSFLIVKINSEYAFPHPIRDEAE
ncbi:MFS transporter [Klebsiella oxytoca]|uniref:MFS transporter n=2 Tax=Klebsiella michiganensis TaxID=1134687 RepID=UPI0012B9B630|nr:MFS transporter [Klebsiella michiganensis]